LRAASVAVTEKELPASEQEKVNEALLSPKARSLWLSRAAWCLAAGRHVHGGGSTLPALSVALTSQV
jgi:hypothetical protein